MSFKKSLVAILSFTLATGFVFGSSYTIDSAHADVGFSVLHLGVSKTRGQFGQITGKINWDAADPTQASFSGEILVDSLTTHNPKRDQHLKSDDFFDVKKHPTITFVSTKIVDEEGDYQVYGNLTMHGVTQEVYFPLVVHGPVKGPGGDKRIGFEGRLTLDRRDYGLTWSKSVAAGELVVGNEVTIYLDIEAKGK